MGWQPIPDDDQGASDPLPEVAQGFQHLLGADASLEVPRKQPRRTVQGSLEGNDAADFPSLAYPSEDGGCIEVQLVDPTEVIEHLRPGHVGFGVPDVVGELGVSDPFGRTSAHIPCVYSIA